MLVRCRYKIEEGEIPPLDYCAAMFNEEQQDAIRSAFGTINVDIEVDDTWGFCKIVAVEGHPIK